MKLHRLQTRVTLSRVTREERLYMGAPWPEGTWVESSVTSNATTVSEEIEGEQVGVLDPGQWEIAGYIRERKGMRA